MGDGLFSIIVLNWNRLKYSKQTIENLIVRTQVKHEFIFVDNNSAEESGVRQYLKSVKGNKNTVDIKYVFNNRNLGVGNGRSSGIYVSKGDYIFNIDDDVIVPINFDHETMEICDKVPKLGITGINVEPNKYPVKILNGVKCCPKNGNLGGAALCMSKKIHKIVGYYNGFSLYAHEDCCMFYRLQRINLISAYIPSRGIHLDDDKKLAYRAEKNKAHVRGSKQLSELSKYLKVMRATGDVYVPFDPNNIPEMCDEKDFTNDLIKKG